MSGRDVEASPAITGPALALIGVCFFLSGATALVYEVVWLRMLALVFGHTVYAITTVLAAVMGGLALGSAILGRRVGRIRNLIAAYGWLEVGVGLSCALTPLLLWLASPVYLGLHGRLGLSHAALTLIQFLIVFPLLLPPCLLMGGTLPVLSHALARRSVGLGRTVGLLYAVNTFGAVVGVAVTGYGLIPALGNRATIAIAAVANLAVGVLALACGRRLAARPVGEATEDVEPEAAVEPDWRPPDEEEPPPVPDLARWLTVAALGIAGAVAMLYEVAWTRALALVIGSSTYAFTAMLIAFLVGIAGGSALYSWLWGARHASPAAFGIIQAGAGLAAAVTLLGFERLPAVFLVGLEWSDAPGFVHLMQVLLSAGTLLPSTLLIGASFPCAVAVATRGAAGAGRSVGHIYAINTLGAIGGTVLAGFALIPAIGVHAAIKAGVAINLVLAAALLSTPPYPVAGWRWGVVAVALAAGSAVWFAPAWDRGLMSSGPAVYGKNYVQEGGRARLAEAMRRQQMLFYRDGPGSTVAVYRSGEHVFLRVNGKTDASTGADMATQLMLGHLPLLVHPEPRRVLVVGLGSGVTARAVARHPVERLDVAEIEPGVVEASRFFSQVNGDVLADPRVRLSIADGRNLLLTTPERYDVIISEPSNPWISGLASLFSAEFFELARLRLRPDGIMVQWVHAYSLFPDDFRMVVRTFRTVFPATSIWSTGGGDFLLLGAARPTPLDVGTMRARFESNPGLAEDFERLGLGGWASLLGYFVLDEADAERYSRGARLNTDDRLPLEFSAPRALHLDTGEANWRLIRSFRRAELPDMTPGSRAELDRAPVSHAIGMAYLARSLPEDALAQFQRALELDPRHAPSMLRAGGLHLRLGRPADALNLARRVAEQDPKNVTALFLAGLASARLNAPAQAIAFLERASALEPQNGRIRGALIGAQLAELRGGAPLGAEEEYLSALLAR